MPSNAEDFKKSNTIAPTPANQWKKSAGAKPIDLELPSGNVARVRQIPMPTLLSDGVFPDTLRGYVQKAIGEDKPAKPGQPEDHKKKKSNAKALGDKELAEMMNDPQKLQDMFTVFDKVLVLAVIEPEVLAVPEDEADRDDSKLYADEVDLADKTFIFQFCVGGSKDLERFRAESAPLMGGLENLQSLPSSP